MALGVGAALAGASPETHAVLGDYSDALGIAYQIRDDIEDLANDFADADGFGAPSLVLARPATRREAPSGPR